jgi:hypothetical protein
VPDAAAVWEAPTSEAAVEGTGCDEALPRRRSGFLALLDQLPGSCAATPPGSPVLAASGPPGGQSPRSHAQV